MATFEVTYDKVPKHETYGSYGMQSRIVNVPGWRWSVYDDSGQQQVADGFIYGGQPRKRRKAIRLARRIAKTHTYSEDVITRGDARAMKSRIEALELEVLTS